MKLTFITVILLALNCCRAYSQSVDSSKTFSGSVSITGLYQSGNTNKFNVQGKGDVRRVNKKLETILNLAATYGEYNRRKDDNSYYGSLTADFDYKKTFSPFVLQYIEYNFSKGIDLRSQSGAGIKYLFLPGEKHKTSVSMAVIYDYLNLASKPGNAKSKELRLSFRLKTKQELFDKHLTLSLQMMYQPVINYLSKANFYITSNLGVPISKLFQLVIDYTYGFDNVVSVGRKRADNKLTFGLKMLF